MHIRKSCLAAGALIFFCSVVVADTLTFIAQPGPGGTLDYNWFNSGNWFISDTNGNLSAAGRLPLADETAVIIGAVDAGSGGGIRLQTLLATNNAVIANGRFAVLNVQMLGGSSFSNSMVNVLTSVTIGGTNCSLNATVLTVFGTASGVFTPVAPAPIASLILANGTTFQNDGFVSLRDGSQINGGGGLQSSFVIGPGAVLSSTNQTLVQGPATNHLIVDNSGLMRADGGTLRFGAGIDWHSAAGTGEFQASSTNALLLYSAPFNVDSNVVDSFTGPGTNRWLAGATLDGTAQVMGNLEIADSVSGAGFVRVSSNAAPGGVLTWINGTFSAPQIVVDSGANMVLDGGPGTARELGGSVLNNSGLCDLRNGDLSLSQGGAISNLIGATIDFQATNSVKITETNGNSVINNAGVVHNSGGGLIQFGSSTQNGPDFNNSGLLDVASGQINLLGGINSGEFRTAAGAELWFWGGTNTLNSGVSFTGPGSVRLLQGLMPPAWLANDAIQVASVELGSNGSIDASGNLSGKPVHFDALQAEANGILARGTYEAGTGQLSDSSTLTNCTLNILSALTVTGTNCSLASATLNIAQAATATLSSPNPSTAATLNLSQGSIVKNEGLIALSDRSQIIGTSSPQSQILLLPGAILSSTNSTYLQGSPTNHLIIDNSGLVRSDGGTLRFGDSLDWKSALGLGEFRASAPGSVISFEGPFHVDSGVTSLFTGSGTNRWLAGATISGTAQVGSTNSAAQSALPGNVDLLDSISGTGVLQLMGNSTQAGLLTWINGTIGLPQVSVGIGGYLLIVDSPAASRHLSGCRVSNSGHCVWLSQSGIAAGNGAVLDNAGGAVLDLQTDTVLSFDNIPPMTALNNAGTFLKSSGSGTTTLAVDFKNSGTVDVQAGILSHQGFWVQTAGSAQIESGAVLVATNLNIMGGKLSGSGTVNGTVNNAAVVSPGTSPGTLTISPGKDYQQTSIGTLKVEIGGHAPGLQYDQLAVGGTAILAGRLQVSLINGFTAQPGDTFQIITCTAESGAFSNIDPTGIPGTSWLPHYNGTNVTLVLANSVVLSPPVITGGSVNISFPTLPGLQYWVQATDVLVPPNWQTIKIVVGDGTVQTVSDPITKTQRFYRIAPQ
jgi:hypothetical protein